MGKSKQAKEMTKKFNRNVEISAPILDPEIIKAIHTPPKGQKLDIKNGGFKALLADLNSQDSTDELSPLDDNHVPTYIGISCAVSGYSNYSSYVKRPLSISRRNENDNKPNDSDNQINENYNNREHDSRYNHNPLRSSSPFKQKVVPQVNHIKIDKNSVSSVDQERRELTEKLTASVTERRRSPSPCIPPTEDDRHHGAYVKARYCPVPPPSKLVNKHIPLLGIDDEQDPDEVKIEECKVEDRIASLYGDDFVDDWRQSNAHKVRREQEKDTEPQPQAPKTPRDLVTLKPTPQQMQTPEQPVAEEEHPMAIPATKVLAGVDRQFLNRLLTDENPPVPMQTSQPRVQSPVTLSPTGNKDLTEVKTTNEKESPGSPSIRLEAQQPKELTSTIGEFEKLEPVNYSPEPVELMTELEPESMIIHEPIEEPHEVKDQVYIETNEDSQENRGVNIEEGTIPVQALEPATDQQALDQNQTPLLDLGETPSPQQLPSPIEQLSEFETDSRTVETTDQRDLLGNEETPQTGEEHIEYQIRAQSPVANESSPVHMMAPGNYQASVVHQDDAQQLIDLDKDLQIGVKLEAARVSDLITIEEEEDPSSLPGAEEVSEATQMRDQDALEENPRSEAKAGDSDGHDGRYFFELLNTERAFIMEQVAKAEMILSEQRHEDAPDDGKKQLDEETIGKLRSAVGMANLLINKKFKQFGELCEANINKDANEQFATLNDDLAGFWDMLEIQISEVRRSFANLGSSLELASSEDKRERD